MLLLLLHCHSMKQALCIKCAKKEVETCNFEIQHLFTYVLYKNQDLQELVRRLEEGDALTVAVNEYSIHRQ